MSPSPPPIVQVDRLCVRYQQTEVLTDISFAAEAGDYIGVAGPNGSGKSTLIKAMLGLVPIASGRVRLYDKPSPQFGEWQRVGYLPQVSMRLQKSFPANVEEVVASGLLSCKRFPRRLNVADRDRVREVLDLLRVEPLAKRMIGQLSGGQQQRVFLARALVSNPDLLILDEPTVALDPNSRERFYETLMELNRDHGKTVLLITHDSGTVGRYASKMLYLDRKLIFYGTFGEFCESPEMTRYFGPESQHIVCHQHNEGAGE